MNGEPDWMQVVANTSKIIYNHMELTELVAKLQATIENLTAINQQKDELLKGAWEE